MRHFLFTSKSETDTKNFAKSLAPYLEKQDVIVLTGELGSGKTKFMEGILSYFNLENEISSPTFTLVNEYCKDDIKLYHFDIYRLADSSEFYEMGGEEYLENGICFIEWGELIKDILPKNHLHITFKKDDNQETFRTLKITTNSKKWEDYFENIKY